MLKIIYMIQIIGSKLMNNIYRNKYEIKDKKTDGTRNK